MNREVVELREVIKKLVPLLAGRGLKVTQRGSQAYVKADPYTKKPIEVNIPCISDNATPEFLRAIQGFIDHEVAHVLYTDFNLYGGGPSQSELADPEVQKLLNTHNIVEDTMIERLMMKEFPGSGRNISDVRKYFLNEITAKALKTAKDDKEAFIYLLVPAMRALADHPEMQEFMDVGGYWKNERVDAIVKGLKPATLKLLKTCKTTKETLEIAKELNAILYPPQPPAPAMPAPPSKSKGKSKDKPDQKAGSGDGDGERDHDETEGDENEDQEKSASGKKSSKKDKADDEAEEDEAASSDDNQDAEEDSGDDDLDESSDDGAADDEDDGESSGDAGDSEEEKSESEDGSDKDGKDDEDSGDSDEDDGEADEGDKSDESGSDESESSDDGDESASGGSEVDKDGDDEDGGGSGGGKSPEENADENDAGKDKRKTAQVITSGADGGGVGNIDVEVEDADSDGSAGGGGVGNEGARSLFDFESDAFEAADMSAQIAILISDEAVDAMVAADYVVYTREFDRIEPVKLPKDMEPSWVPRMEEEVASMTGRMSKDIERLMASQSHVIRTPGHRKGKLHAPSLFRVSQGDPRVFTQKQEHVSKDTAVTLLCDNSGSMHGQKMKLAMISAYALATTLERVRISYEVLGFTTGGYYEAPASVREAMEADMRKSGIRYDRVQPLMIPIYKDFDERMSAIVKERFAYMMNAQRGLAGNIDGESLEYAAMRLMKRPEHRKVMLVLSDGQPAGSVNSGPHLSHMTRQLEKVGIECVGIGIMDDSVARYYPKYVVLRDVADLPGEVMQEIKKILA